MDHQTLIQYGLSKPGTQLKYPFDPDLPVLFVGNKMFALFGHTNGFPSVNLKADPEEAFLQRNQYSQAVFPGYHMNKRHWNTVVLNNTLSDEDVLGMFDDSYQLVFKGLPRHEKNKWSLS